MVHLPLPGGVLVSVGQSAVRLGARSMRSRGEPVARVEAARTRLQTPRARLKIPKTSARDSAPRSGRANSATPRITESNPPKPYRARSPAVSYEANAMANSPTPVTTAQAPIQIVSARAV